MCTYSITHLYVNSLIPSIILSSIHIMHPSFIHLFTGLLALFIDWPIAHSLTHSLTHSFIGSSRDGPKPCLTGLVLCYDNLTNEEKRATRRHSGMSFSDQNQPKGKQREMLQRAHLHGERQPPWAGSPTALGLVHPGYVSALPPSLLARFGLLLCWTWGPIYAPAPSSCGPSVWPRLGRATDNASEDSGREEKTRQGPLALTPQCTPRAHQIVAEQNLTCMRTAMCKTGCSTCDARMHRCRLMQYAHVDACLAPFHAPFHAQVHVFMHTVYKSPFHVCDGIAFIKKSSITIQHQPANHNLV